MATRVTFPFTQKQAFSALISLIETGEAKYESVSKNGDKSIVKPNLDILVDFLTYKVEQADKKSDAPRKPTAKQVAAVLMTDKLFDEMENGKAYSIADMILNFDCFKDKQISSQYVTSLLHNLINLKKVKRISEKGKVTFARIV
jgi:hypothetical protein